MRFSVFVISFLILLLRNWFSEKYFGATNATYWRSFHIITDVSLFFLGTYVLLVEDNKWMKMCVAVFIVIIAKDILDRSLLNVYWYTWSDFYSIGVTLLIFAFYKPWRRQL